MVTSACKEVLVKKPYKKVYELGKYLTHAFSSKYTLIYKNLNVQKQSTFVDCVSDYSIICDQACENRPCECKRIADF